jgi:hypothetical protein
MKCQCSPDCELTIDKDRVLCLECFALLHPEHYEKHLKTHRKVNIYETIKTTNYEKIKIPLEGS